MKRLLAITAALIAAAPASAWGVRGHRAIADIAWAQLTPAARRGIVELLTASPMLETPACPVGSLADASTWADCVRSRYRGRFADTATWHYVNVSVCGPFNLPRDDDGLFVVERYRRELAMLRDRSRPVAERLGALLWVAHLIGDLHQPLHVGDANDRGGNEVTVVGDYGRYPLNLHAEWDRNLVDEAISAQSDGIAGLAVAAADPVISRRWHNPDPSIWAQESWGIARTAAYPRSAVGDACRVSGAVVVVDTDYRRAAVPVVAGQLEKAGVRLADVLNSAMPGER
jgi:hypothetical protein